MKNKHMRLAVTALVLSLCLCFSGCQRREDKVLELLDLGEKYLLELDYEGALAVFNQVLEIDSKNAAAYEGIAESCLGMGDTEGALDALGRGYAETGDGALAEREAEINEAVAYETQFKTPEERAEVERIVSVVESKDAERMLTEINTDIFEGILGTKLFDDAGGTGRIYRLPGGKFIYIVYFGASDEMKGEFAFSELPEWMLEVVEFRLYYGSGSETGDEVFTDENGGSVCFDGEVVELHGSYSIAKAWVFETRYALTAEYENGRQNGSFTGRYESMEAGFEPDTVIEVSGGTLDGNLHGEMIRHIWNAFADGNGGTYTEETAESMTFRDGRLLVYPAADYLAEYGGLSPEYAEELSNPANYISAFDPATGAPVRYAGEDTNLIRPLDDGGYYYAGGLVYDFDTKAYYDPGNPEPVFGMADEGWAASISVGWGFDRSAL